LGDGSGRSETGCGRWKLWEEGGGHWEMGVGGVRRVAGGGSWVGVGGHWKMGVGGVTQVERCRS
jgi:hypothetical protein